MDTALNAHAGMLCAMPAHATDLPPNTSASASIGAPGTAPVMPQQVHDDAHAMQLALSLAQQALWLSNPNPRVGCVITAASGHVLGSGHTQAAGSAHAEVMALADAAQRGNSVAGATAFVTLEPCAHTGRTPPCCDALIAIGIKRVVVAALDPNPQVAGQGVARMRAAGIAVSHGLLAGESQWLNIGFFSRMLRNKPWVRLKMAASVDGITALPNGHSQWITCAQARADGHAFRARACAVLTGAGTVLSDDPQLSVRGLDIQRQPHLVVVDSRLQTPLGAKLLAATTPARAVWLYHSGSAPADTQAALTHAGAELRTLRNAAGKVDLSGMFSDLAHRGVNEVHVEAGSALNGSLLREGLVDELLLYVAPKLLGQGLGLSGLGPFERLSDAIEMTFAAPTVIGSDIRLQAVASGADAFINDQTFNQ